MSQAEPWRPCGPGNLHASKQANSRLVSLPGTVTQTPEGSSQEAVGKRPVLGRRRAPHSSPASPGPGRAGEQKAGPGRERPELCCPSRQHSATRQMSPPPRHTAHRAPCLHGFRPSATVLVLFLRCPPHPEGSPEERAFDSHSPAYHRSMQVQIKQQGAGGKCRVWREACPRAFRAETEIPAAESSPGNESKRLSVLGARACLALSPKRTFVGIPV